MKSVRHIVWYKNRDYDWSSVYTNSSKKIVDKVWTKFFHLGMPIIFLATQHKRHLDNEY